MRESRENLTGPLTISELIDLLGNVGGDCTVIKGGKVYVRGAIFGNLTVEDGGRVHVLGHISGDVFIEEGSKVILSGPVGGSVTNNGGRLYVHATASVMGKWKLHEGKSEFEPGAKKPV